MLELKHLTVLTLRRARESRVPAHNLAQFVCIMERDGAPSLAVSFVSVERVLDFIDQMQPPSIRIDGASGEDISALCEALSEAMIQSMPAPLRVTLH
jgi:hypothetical protein